ncbi:CPBP family intramembrane metalloprotease [Blastococcus sp. CT_GayMR19]|uniref:CPBP family intramembrane glutamic endopeptidase n=1 Tax=Blastococcus sp. CT_GayMR19 TaxID=2559608 RepID=UPI0010747301|nr:CPBP family intramembrane glutamic endopeptidase [Blastococcus sp. CT_GayMR19]TFV69558.1 CPBP family intramembrane metalloprotease [Blastococcus sp. CT_GayMR19]
MRSRTWAGWRPAVGLLLLVVVYLVAAVLTLVAGMIGLIVAEGAAFSESALDDLSSPGVILVINLVTAVAIPVVWLVWAAAHGMRIGWSSSVLGRLRWRLLPWYTLLALGTVGVGICVSLVLSLSQEGDTGGPVASYGWLLVVVFLTTPLQAAAEEYLFRGYLSQAVAGWVRRPMAGAVLAALVSGTLFSLVHLPPDLPSFLFYLSVGLAASAVVWLTGGLEAAIALHTVNNVVIFVLAGALGEDVLASAESTAGVPWFDVALTLVAMAVFVALVARSRRRLQPETMTRALDLRAPAPPVAVPAH